MKKTEVKKRVKVDFSKARTYPLGGRKCKVDLSDFGTPKARRGQKFADFAGGLPKILAARDIADFASLAAAAAKKGLTVAAAIGGHIVKTGVTPYLIDLMERGVIKMISMNGSAAIHDLEIALNGRTSEDVAEALVDGSFGMAYETGKYMNDSFARARKNSTGAGREIALTMKKLKAPFRKSSIIYRAHELSIPATVHIAVGTDIVHVHPNADGADIGAATFNDFKIYCETIAAMEPGSVYMNLGSAVIMPEVFLKALTIVRNLGFDASGFHTANFDMINQYRPNVNVLSRPTIGSGGRCFNFIGCHEIMIPLLHSMLVERLAGNGREK